MTTHCVLNILEQAKYYHPANPTLQAKHPTLHLFLPLYNFTFENLSTTIEQGHHLPKLITLDNFQQWLFEKVSTLLQPLVERSIVAFFYTSKAAQKIELGFMRFLETINIPAFFSEYPFLKKLIEKSVFNYIDSTTIVLNRLDDDWLMLMKHFKIADARSCELTDIKTCGDPHNGQQQSAILTFAIDAQTYRIVYKPRSFKTNQAWQNILDKVNPWLDNLECLSPSFIMQEHYGWEQHLTYETSSKEALPLFYKRMGTLLCLAYIFRLKDGHLYNLLAHNNFPVLIDLECLFYPDFSGVLQQQTNDFTLLDTDMLPVRNYTHDQSGLSGKTTTIPKPYHFTFQIENDIPKVDRENAKPDPAFNLPSPDTDPKPYISDVAEGFKHTYLALIEHKTELLDLLESITLPSSRILLRPTRFYKRLLLEAPHPSIVKSQESFEAYIKTCVKPLFNSEELDNFVLKSEIEALSQGDIPLFLYDEGQQHLVQNESVFQLQDGLPRKAIISQNILALSELNMAHCLKMIIEI
jgi:lantibiotic modifying enzyme